MHGINDREKSHEHNGEEYEEYVFEMNAHGIGSNDETVGISQSKKLKFLL